MRAAPPSAGALAGIFALTVACSGSHVVSSGNMRAYEVSLAVSGPLVALAWHGGTGDRNAIYMEWLDGDGRATSAPARVTNTPNDAYEPDLQLVGRVPIVAWYEKDLQRGTSSAWLARLDVHGHLLWRRALSAAGGSARNPVVRTLAGAIAVAWIETPAGSDAMPEVWAARYDLEGRQLTPPVRAGPANADTWNLNAAIDAKGAFYIVYDAAIGTRTHELRLAIVDHDEARNISLIPDDGLPRVYPDIRFSRSGSAAITWFDEHDGTDQVEFEVLSAATLGSGHVPPWSKVTAVPSSSFGSYLAWNADRLELAWCDNRTGRFEVYVRTFDASGKPLGQEHRVSDPAATGSIPSVQPYGSGFLVAWNEYRSRGGPGHGHILSSVAKTARIH
jgi:hypothetical protein